MSDLKWWIHHKNKLYGCVLIVVGVLGGNADRIPEVVADILPYQTVLPIEVTETIKSHSESLVLIVKNQEILQEELDKLRYIVHNLESSLTDTAPRIPIQ